LGLSVIKMTTTNLPVQLTSFIGRLDDLRAVEQLLSTSRLVTLIGPGGSGKTRLAFQIASQIGSFYEGAWLVELAPLCEPALLPQFVAQALDLHPTPDLSILELLLNFISTKQMLLILDNCEHLADACAELILQLLSHAPNLHILATSREALAIPGENIYPVSGLAYPTLSKDARQDGQSLIDPQELNNFDAVNLLVERGRAISPQFGITSENASAIVEVCRRLDGMPLALELASARLNVLTIEEIASRINDRFILLTTGTRRGVDPRHHTLRTTIDWSYDLLKANEQALLRRMAVFTAGCTLDMFEAFYASELQPGETTINLISSLVNKSLVVAETTGRAQIRYRLLESIRQYLFEKLERAGEAETWRDRHLELFMTRAEEAMPKLGGTYQQLWLNWLDDEHDNLRAALAWALESEKGSPQEITRLEAGLRIASALMYYWGMRGELQEGLEWSRHLLARADDRISLDVRVNAIVFASFLAMFLGDGALSLQYGCEAVTLAESAGSEGKPLMAFALAGLASGEKTAGDYPAAFATGERVVQLYRELEPPLNLGMALLSQGETALCMGNYAIARERWRESLSLAQRDQDSFRIAYSLNYLGDLARMEQNYVEAVAKYRESEALLRELNTPGYLASILSNLGFTFLHLGEIEPAQAKFRESMTIYQEVQNQRGTIDNLVGFAAAAIQAGLPSAGVRLLAAAEALSGLPAASTWPATQMEFKRSLDLARAELANSDFQLELAAGQGMSLGQAVDYALKLPLNFGVMLETRHLYPEPTMGLTGREREIAVLIAQGKTNGDIAAELFLSRRTIETHASHILSKLGLSRRSQVVRWALDHGLTKDPTK
jgi:predicted ATPase/DNA-binding CsgD family transcriptional regulator